MNMPTKAEQKEIGVKILEYMENEKMVITPLNIVYIEGVDPIDDWFRENSDILDYWNDTRNLIADDGTFLMSAIATTEPGRYYTMQPMNPNGAARVAFGQYLDAWEFGTHGVSYPHESLMQIRKVKFHRDLNQDGMRTGDRIYEDVIGMNQHTTSNAPRSIELWGAGCLVGRYPSTHQEFIRQLKKTRKKTFHTAILNGSLLHKRGILPPNPYRKEQV